MTKLGSYEFCINENKILVHDCITGVCEEVDLPKTIAGLERSNEEAIQHFKDVYLKFNGTYIESVQTAHMYLNHFVAVKPKTNSVVQLQVVSLILDGEFYVREFNDELYLIRETCVSYKNKSIDEYLSETYCMVRGYLSYVFRTNCIEDSTNHGISQRDDKLYIIPRAEDVIAKSVHGTVQKWSCDGVSFLKNCVFLHTKEDVTYVKPVLNQNRWYMSGGNLLYSYDSRWSDVTGVNHPICIHDRCES